MEIRALGYVGLGSAKLDDWSDYATRWLGMQAAGACALSEWTTGSSA